MSLSYVVALRPRAEPGCQTGFSWRLPNSCVIRDRAQIGSRSDKPPAAARRIGHDRSLQSKMPVESASWEKQPAGLDPSEVTAPPRSMMVSEVQPA